MNKQLNQLLAFHKAFGAGILNKPGIPSQERCDLRLNLLSEELEELKEAIDNNDIVGIADALVDIQYVLSGSVIEFGLSSIFEKLFDEVHASNMSKLDENGNAIIREDGKVLKSSLYFKPNLKPIIDGASNN
jgi:predicted HAD superfamily Cof-like phosphohydrolase